ncbi:MAG TPA: hypothetical protein VGD56_05915 [Gemmatirosa sp.]
MLPATAADGQWVWSTADVALWRGAHAARPALRPGVWVSTVWWAGGAAGGVQQRLALSPAPFTGARLAVVVRFDDRMHAAWLAASDSVIAAQLDARLATLLRLVAGTGARVTEVQLDYDCPVRRLARWAAVVRQVHAGALAGREVWVTSLVAHVAQREYGAQFRGVVSGHIVQLFDTGDEPSPAAATRLAAQLDRVALPYRVGLGAFERVLPSGDGRTRLTHHRAWFALAPELARSPWYRGLWVFPGGQPWTSLVASPGGRAPASGR